MRNRYAAVLGAVLAVTAAMASSCTSDNEPKSTVGADCVAAHQDLKTVNKGLLTVATYPYPPFTEIDGSKLTGFEGDLLHKVAAMECLTVNLQQTPPASAVSAVTSGRADTAIGDWYRTAERTKIVSLGGPIITDSMAIISTVGDLEIGDLKGKRVGSGLGYLWVDDVKAMLGGDLKLYPDPQSGYADLRAGRIDALLDTVPSAIYQLKVAPIDGANAHVPKSDERVKASQKPGQTQFMSSLKNPDLASFMTEDIEKLRTDGTIKDLLTKYGLPEEIGNPGAPSLL